MATMKHAEDAAGCHAAKGPLQQHHRHGRIDATPQQQGLRTLSGHHACDDQQDAE